MKTRFALLLVAIGIVLALLIGLWPLTMRSRVESRLETVQKGAQVAGDLQQMQENTGTSVTRSNDVSSVVAQRKANYTAPASDPFVALEPQPEAALPPTAAAVPEGPASSFYLGPGMTPGGATEPSGMTPSPTGTAPSGSAPPGSPGATMVAVVGPGGKIVMVPKETPWPAVRVQGLALSEKNSLAVIDNDVYGANETLGGLKVVEVNDKGVVLASEKGQKRELPLIDWLQGGKAQ